MKISKTLFILSIGVALLGAVAAGAGLLGQGDGSPFAFTTLRGETVMVRGSGLYYYDTVASASQVIGGDYVTLLLCVPLLLVSALLAARGSLRARLLLSGALGYFLYTYMSISFNLAYNPLFLLYVAIFSLSLFAFVLSLMSFDLDSLAAHFSPRVPRWPIAAFLFLIGIFLVLNWAGRLILPSLLSGQPPVGLESTTTMVIQAMDLGIIAPAAFLAGVLWLKRSRFGSLLVPVLLVKGFSMSAAIAAMIVGQLAAGVNVALVEIVMFPLIGLINVGMLVVMLKHVREQLVPDEPFAVAGEAA